jgi:hypothetical protein
LLNSLNLLMFSCPGSKKQAAADVKTSGWPAKLGSVLQIGNPWYQPPNPINYSLPESNGRRQSGSLTMEGKTDHLQPATFVPLPG